MQNLCAGRSASEANIGAPGNGVELDVALFDLARLGVDGKLVHAFDWVDVQGKPVDIPSPQNIIAVVEDSKGVHGADWRGLGHTVNEDLLAGEGWSPEWVASQDVDGVAGLDVLVGDQGLSGLAGSISIGVGQNGLEGLCDEAGLGIGQAYKIAEWVAWDWAEGVGQRHSDSTADGRSRHEDSGQLHFGTNGRD